MTRSATCNLLACFLLGCPGGSDKDTHAGDTADPGLDVSDLLCAGLEDLDGDILVPTTSTNGCTGGAITIQLTCADCSFATDATLALVAMWRNDGHTYGLDCANAPIPPDGAIQFGAAAPFGTYNIDYIGRIASGQIGDMESVDPFEVCSDDVLVEAEVEGLTDGW